MRKKIITIIISLYSIIGFSQSVDTIRGKIVSSITYQRPIGEIEISEKYTSDFVSADSLGYFQMIPKKKKNEYHLVIIAGDYDVQEFVFKSKWINFKKPKHIVVNSKCELDKKKAISDWFKRKPKLYLISGIVPIEFVKKDKRFKRKYGVEYYDFGCETRVTECLINYNKWIFDYLDNKFGDKWRKDVRKDVVGLN